MKKILLPVFAVVAMTLAFSSCGKKKEVQVPEETGPKNLIEFGHFTGGIEPWMLYKNGGKAELRHIKEGELEVAIESTGRIQYGIQPYYDGLRRGARRCRCRLRYRRKKAHRYSRAA